MSIQRRTTPPRRTLHKQRGMWYFEPKKVSDWIWVGFGLGIVLLMAGAISSGSLFFTSGVVLLIACILIRFFAWLSRPDDKQYDDWVEDHAAMLYNRGLDALGLDRRDIVNTLCIRSFVLPGSMAAKQYPDNEVRMKQGKDEQWRFSINVYTYFFLTRHYAGIYKANINAFHPSTPIERKESYSYQHIISATTSLFIDTVNIDKKPFQYRLELCRLELSTGRSVECSAAVKATLLRRKPKKSLFSRNKKLEAPPFPLPDTGFDRTLSRLTHLLLTRGSP